MATKKNKPPLYSWGDGKGKIHTISKADHDQNLEARQYGINLDAPVSAPLSNRQAYGLAQQAAGLQYDPQIQAANQMGQVNAPAWYQNYIARAGQMQQAAAQYAQPVLDQANTWANQPVQAAPGLASSSPAAAQSAQASQSGQNLAKLGADVLGAIQNSTTNYLGGQQAIAARDLPQTRAYYAQEEARLKGERGQAVASSYGSIRGQEQNSQIAYGTLGLNQAGQAADIDIKRGVDPVTGQALPEDAPTGYGPGGPGQNKYGYTYDEWNSLSDAKRASERKGTDNAAKKAAEKAAEKAKKDKAQKQAAIQKASGKVRNRVTDIINAWDRGGTIDVTDSTGKVTGTRKATPDELRSAIVDKYGFTGRIALAIREGRPLDKRAQDYLHNLDPNFRIPREWITGKRRPAPTGTAPLADDGNGQQRPT
jgi:hypothetical protein